MALRPGARAWAVWSVGLAAYIVAVLHRTSLGVAGLDAQHRFHIGAGALASFAVLQLLVYAGLQVPVGLLLDRFGSLRLVVTGALVMAAGQLLMATTHQVGGAVLARVLVGAGDAMTFISVLRLVPQWFPARRVPVLTQLTGIVGQAGQVLSAVPLAALLAGAGLDHRVPRRRRRRGVRGGRGVRRPARHRRARRSATARRSRCAGSAPTWRGAWRHPGTRLGLWTHFTTQFTGTVFALMWGFPFLIAGEGLRRETASALLTLFVLVGMAAGPVIGVLVQRHPLRRSWLVLGVIAANAGGWGLVLAWPGRAPLPVLVLLVLALGLGGPGSMIGFDFARTFNPPSRLGTATGVVNVGGFVASLADDRADRPDPGRPHRRQRRTIDIADFKIAMAVQYLIGAVGLVGILRTRRLARRRLAEEGVVVRPLREVLAERRGLARPRSGKGEEPDDGTSVQG